MFDRFDTSGRADAFDEVFDAYSDNGAIHIEELGIDHHNPFDEDESNHHRWLITTCIAGLAGSVIVGGALLGLFGQILPRGAGEVGLRPLWQQTASTAKGDLAGAETAGSRADTSDAAEVPFKRVPVAYAPGREPADTGARAMLATAAVARYPAITDDFLPYGASREPAESALPVRTASLAPGNVTTVVKTAPPDPVEESFVVSEGDSLLDHLTGFGITADAANAMATAVELVYPARSLADGQEFTITIDHRPDFYGQYTPYPTRLSFSPVNGEEIVVEADQRGRYVARIDTDGDARTRLSSLPYQRVKSRISSTLYTTAKNEGIPEHVIAELMRVHSFNVDFQREIKEGDGFEVFFGQPLTGSSNRKVLLYSALSLGDKERGYYRFTTPDDGITDYYDADGKSVRKALMRTPISGARISSGFGLRKHPILGYNKMHAGVDFAASRGTPIKAAGDGVIELAGRLGAYGKYVRIRHANSYKTAYAHMSRIARGVTPSTKVRQGQVIGYVGSSGRSTGPHLHYEVLVNDKRVNPLKVDLADGRKLDGELLESFKAHKARIEAMMQAAPVATQVARGPSDDSTSQ